MSDVKPPILNLDNYLSYLTPDIAAQYEMFRNVQIFALGVYVCDMLSTVPQEVEMMRSTRFTLSICTYWIARVFAFVDLTCVVFSTTGPVRHCQEIFLGISASYWITAAATSFLFLIRVRTVFFSNKTVQWCFSALWLATIVVWILAPIGAVYSEIVDTKHCITTRAPRFLVASYFVPLIYDSLVFLGISYKVTTYCVPQYQLTWRTFFTRPVIHGLPRAILHGGQQYYLVSLCASVIAALLLLIPTVPPVYRAIIINPGMALTSSMACRVFRNLFLQDFEAEGGSKRTDAVGLTTVICQTEVVSGETATSTQEPNQDAVPTIV